MHILRNLDNIPDNCRGATIALGNFDGVHVGHQEILRHAIANARADGGKAAVMTFEPHPREFFGKHHEKLRITSLRDKMELLRALDIDALFLVRFNKHFAAQSAQAFVEHILHETLAARHVVTGYNFAFGKNRGGDTAFLDKTAAGLGMGYTACPPVYDADGKPISSSAIRKLLTAGDMQKAAALLGRPYRITGRVRRGEQRGRTLGIPTANVSLALLFKPRLGVYAARIGVGGAWHDGVASIGVKPTFGVHEPLLEAHIFDKKMDLYGQRIEVELVQFMRDEKHFDDIGALQKQMMEDCREAKIFL